MRVVRRHRRCRPNLATNWLTREPRSARLSSTVAADRNRSLDVAGVCFPSALSLPLLSHGLYVCAYVLLVSSPSALIRPTKRAGLARVLKLLRDASGKLNPKILPGIARYRGYLSSSDRDRCREKWSYRSSTANFCVLFAQLTADAAFGRW